VADDADKQAWLQRVLGFEPGGAPDPEAEGLAGEDEYRAYLVAATKRLRSSGKANFGLVLGKKREEHRIMLHPAKSAKSLASSLAGETGLHAMTWGTAQPSPDRATTMLLVLEGRQLAGIKKKAEQMLKVFKPLPFAKVALLVGGAEVDDLADPDYEDTEDLPASVLPDAPATLSPQGQSLAGAARNGSALCEECAAPVTAEPAMEEAVA
jgi:hypothetical protein